MPKNIAFILVRHVKNLKNYFYKQQDICGLCSNAWPKRKFSKNYNLLNFSHYQLKLTVGYINQYCEFHLQNLCRE